MCGASALARLSEPQRIGQLFMVGVKGTSLTASELAAFRAGHFGSIWIDGNRTSGAAPIRALANAVQALASADTGGVRYLVAADQEGGFVQRLSGPGFSTIPPALVQGSYPTSTLRADATTWGRQLAAAGVNLDLAPVMDVVPPGTDGSNPPIGALEREYGHDPATVAAAGDAVLAGMRQAGVGTALKHFPGLGRVTANTDFASGVVDTVTTSTDPYLGSFRSGIAAGARFVMVALATYERIDPSRLAVFSPVVMGNLLRGRLGFRGVIVSDSLSAVAVSTMPAGSRAIDFVAAGGDLIVVDDAPTASAMASAIAARVAHDPAFRATVDAAALSILTAKAAMGLVSCG